MQVFEPPVRNSGIAGGKFLERQKVYKPQSEEIYTYMDMYVGATMQIFNRTFELMEADEYTYTYMENVSATCCAVAGARQGRFCLGAACCCWLVCMVGAQCCMV